MSTSKAKRKTKPPELKIVFDTNILWTGSASDLLRQEVLELIRANSNHSDLTITWYLPDVVRHERQYQMLRQALELLPSIQKLERLLGHNLNITEQIIQQRVQEAVERQLQEIDLHILPLEPSNVDWNQMMLNAAYRRPPFSTGEKEKGFRDALVAEEFLQLVFASPVTPKVCRIALVSSDNVLVEAVKARTNEAANVRILLSLEDLKGLINTLVSEISEEFVAKIQAKAQSYFFEVEQKDSLYYKWDIRNKIREKFQDKLSEVPENAAYRDNGTWRIHSPRFKKKQGQRVFWVTRFTVEAEAYKYVSTTSYEYSPLSYEYDPSGLRYIAPHQVAVAQLNPTLLSPQYATNPLMQTNLLAPLAGNAVVMPTNAYRDPLMTPRVSQTKSVIAKGRTIFEITWSVAVTTSGNFSAPKVESLDFTETIWE